MWQRILCFTFLLAHTVLGSLLNENDQRGRLEYQLDDRRNVSSAVKLGKNNAGIELADKLKDILQNPNEDSYAFLLHYLSPIDFDEKLLDNLDTGKQYSDIEGLNLDMRVKSKRFPSPENSWMYLLTKEGIQSSLNTRSETPQEKKSTTFHPWDDTRVTVLSPSTKIRRPIRVPFNSWGGKRGSELSEAEKRSDLIYDLNVRSVPSSLSIEENGRGNRIPFNSWGGKRSLLRDQRFREFILESERGKQISSYSDNGEEHKSLIAPAKRSYEFVDAGFRRNRALRATNSKMRIRFNSWGGKRNDRLSLLRNVDQSDNGHLDEINEIDNDDRNQMREINNKRRQQKLSRPGFQAWGGKRSPSNEALVLVDNYSDPPPESTRRQIFFPWGG